MISKDQKENIICTIDECGETFYDRHTAQHPAAVIIKPMMTATDCIPCILNDIDLVVITISSVYCGHKHNTSNLRNKYRTPKQKSK